MQRRLENRLTCHNFGGLESMRESFYIFRLMFLVCFRIEFYHIILPIGMDYV